MSFHIDISKSSKLGLTILEPSISQDKRGTIWSSFFYDQIDMHLHNNLQFKHDKFSESCNNVLRGIHGDSKSWKLVTAVYGEIFQVVVDLRKDSNSFKQYESFTLNSHSPKSVLIPPGMGNAYYVLSKKAVYHYKLAYDGEYIDADEQFSFAWNDKSINIEWPSNKPILSERDK